MKKRLLSLLLSLLLGLSLGSGAAWADNTILVNLGTAEAGVYADRLLGTTERGSAFVSGGALPEGCQIVTETRDGGAYHYLRGTPMEAGDYEFTLSVTAPVESGEAGPMEDEESAPEDAEEAPAEETPAEGAEEIVAELMCSLTVVPATPTVQISQDVSCNVGEEVSLSVSAEAADNGALSYQWYSGESRSSQGGALLDGAISEVLRVIAADEGTKYYYCVVTNTNNGYTAATSSEASAVTAAAAQPTSIAVSTLPAKLEYTVGDSLDTAGLLVSVTYSDGSTEQIDTGFTVTPTRLDTVGTQSILVSYEGLRSSFSVQVKEEEEQVLELQIVTLPQKLDYTVGEWLDTTGMVLRVDTNKGSYDVSTGFTCSPRTLDREGRQAITVGYGSHSTTFNVDVKAAEERVESVAVARRPAKLSYAVGEYFDPLGLTLNVVTNQGTKEVSEGFTWEPQQFTVAGRQTVLIAYGGKSCKLDLIVDATAETAAPEQSAAPTAAPTPLSTPEPDTAPDTDTRSRAGNSRTAVTVITAAALVGLAALLAYVYLTKKEKITALLKTIGKGFGKK